MLLLKAEPAFCQRSTQQGSPGLASQEASSLTAALNNPQPSHSSSTHCFKRLLAQFAHVSPLFVNQQLNLDQFCGHVLLRIVSSALLLSHLPINVTIWVFKNVVSCNNDFFDVPTAWGGERQTVTLFTEEAFAQLEQFTDQLFMQQEGETGTLNLCNVLITAAQILKWTLLVLNPICMNTESVKLAQGCLAHSSEEHQDPELGDTVVSCTQPQHKSQRSGPWTGTDTLLGQRG